MLVLSLHPHCRTPFGKLHKTNPEIIQLAETTAHRTDLTNGIALNALYGNPFDLYLISVDENFRLVLSEKIKAQAKDEVVKKYFLEFEGKELEMPYRFFPMFMI